MGSPVHASIKRHLPLLAAAWLLAGLLPIFAQTNSITESFLSLRINGTNTVYDMNAATTAPNFEGANLGTYLIGSNSLILRGALQRTSKCAGGTVTASRLRWRVWLTASGPSGTFATINLTTVSSEPGGCGGNQSWQATDGAFDLAANLLPGNYTLEAFTEADGTPSNLVDNNGGANYKATFTIGVDTTKPVLITTGANTLIRAAQNLFAAFALVNAGAVTGAITLRIAGNTNEPVTAVLFASNGSAPNYSSIQIQPFGGVARVITGSLAAPLVVLDGADNVRFDGLNTDGHALTIRNSSTSNMQGTSTITFRNGAENNTLTNCSIMGASTTQLSLPGGTIVFTESTFGNDDNTISNCTITSVGSNLPTKAIFSGGSGINSLCAITNNNISNFFSPSQDSSGIFIAGNCSRWTISNNRFFQTSARVFSGNAFNAPIYVMGTSGAVDGFVISDNTIGFGSASQTGTYTLSGGGGRFIGILYNSVTGITNPSFVTGNTITRISLTATAASGVGLATPFAGIITGLGQVTVNNNVIGNMTATGRITVSTTGISDTEMNGIHALTSSSVVANGNQIGGISVSNTGSNARFGFIGIRMTPSSGSGNLTASSNTIGGTVTNSISNNATSTSAYINGLLCTAATASLTDNVVRNLTTASGTGSGGLASVAGLLLQDGSNQTISRNTISNLRNTFTGSSTVVVGIIFYGNSGNVIDRNTIHSLSAAHSASFVMGILVATGSNTIRNNMITLGRGVADPMLLIGVYDYGGNNNFYHNSVYITGTTSGTTETLAFFSLSGTGMRDIRNNIFCNMRMTTGYSTIHGGLRLPADTSNFIMDHNLYDLAAGNFLGMMGSYGSLFLPDWKSLTGQEEHSVTGNPQFVAPTSATPNLRIKTGIGTLVERRGTALASVTDDFDGEVRDSATPVDIGADAGLFTAIDTTPPLIAYTPVNYGTVGSGRSISGISITDDVSGVASDAGVRPRLYFKKSTDPNTLAGWKFVESTGGYDFLIPYNVLSGGGVVPGDVIQYFIIAQDRQTPANISIAGGTFNTAPTTVDLGAAQFPIGGTIHSYVIRDFISGNKTVCPSGCDFNSLTNTNGAFDVINRSDVAGSMSLFISGDLTNETGTFALDEFNPGTAGTYQIVIRPVGAPRIVSGSSPEALIRLNGADRVTIDGSLSNTNNTLCPLSRASRDLIIENRATSGSPSVIRIHNVGSLAGASNNTIKNCRIRGAAGYTEYGVISGSANDVIGTDLDNNSYINNEISRVDVGISTGGASLANKNTGTIILLNEMDAAEPDNIRRAGIVVLYDEGAVISGNTVAHVKRGLGARAATGISLGMGLSASNYRASGYEEVTGATVSHNMIYDIENTDIRDSYGISIGAISESGTNPNKIWNNSISGIRSGSIFGSATFGIYVGANLGATQLYHNTLSLFGPTSGVTNSYGIFVDNASPTVDIRNNVIVNKGTALSTGKQFGISFTSGTFTNITSNNNSIFVTSDSTHFAIGTGSATTPTGASLSSWTTATGKDAASVSVDPSFTSDDDLRLLAVGANTALVNAGANLSATVATDIDCATRDTTPTVGCKQLTSIPVCAGANGGTAMAVAPILCTSSGQTTIRATGFSTGSNTLYQWQYATTADFSAPVNIGSASTSYADASTGLITAPRYYRLVVTCPSTSQTGYSTVASVAVSDPVVVTVTSSVPTICAGGSVTLTASGATSYTWSPSIGLSATTGTTVTASPTVTTTYTVTGNTNGCTNTATITVNVVPVVPSPVVSSNSPVCPGSPLNLNGGTYFLDGYDMSVTTGQTFFALSESNATAVALTDGMGTITMPPFRFNNVVYTEARVSVNGVLVFGANTGNVSSDNSQLPATVISGTGNSQAAICVHWGANTTSPSSKIFTKSVGDEFIIGWNSFIDVNAKFQIRLNTVTGAIRLLHSGPVNWGEGATIGLNYSAMSALQYSFDTGGTLDSETIRFTPRQATFAWTGPNGFSSTTLNAVVTTPTSLAGGTYILTATDPESGCSASSSVSVVIKPNPEITVSPSGPYCGNEFTITASGATTYSWSPATGLSATTGATVTAQITEPTTYTITGTLDGCTASKQITLHPALSVAAASNSPRCSGETLQLNAPVASTGGYLMTPLSGVAFVDILTTGTTIPLTSGDDAYTITIPPFVYNGTTFTTARIGNDGAVVFGTNAGVINYTNKSLPEGVGSSSSVGIISGSGNSVAALCPYWDDLDLLPTTSVKTQVIGNTVIIQWTDQKLFSKPAALGGITFQVQLELITGLIHFVYQDVTFTDGGGNGTTATIGLNLSSSAAVEYSFNSSSLTDGQSITFTPAVNSYSWTGPNGFTSTVPNPVIPSATEAATGTYTLSVFNSVTGCSSLATTDVVVASIPAGGTITGAGGMCFGANANALTISGYTGSIVRWEKSETPYTEWIEIASTSPTLDPGILYNETKYRALVQSGCGNAYSQEAGFTFASTTWNGSGWTNGLPDGGKSVTFSADFTATSDISACEVFIDSNAKVVFPATEPDSSDAISTGFDLTANGVVFVAFGSLEFEQGSNLIQKDYTGPNAGNIKMKTNVKLWRQDYVYWGSPVEQDPFAMEFNTAGELQPVLIGKTLRSFSPATLSQRFYTFDPAANAFVGQFGANDTFGTQSPLTYTFEKGKGYMVRAPNAFPNPPASPIGADPVTLFSSQFVGVPHNGNVTIPTGNGLSNAHLLSNPYPSPIQVLGPDGFLALNPGTLYFWTHYNQLPASSNYAMCNSFGSTAAYRGGVVPNGTIQVGQGFIFENTTGLPEVTFTNNMRTGNNEGQFFRRSNDASRIWLNIDCGQVRGNQMMVGYSDSATLGADPGLDGLLMPSGTCISSLIGSNRYGIQARPAFSVTDVVPMGLRVVTSGSHTISLDRADGIFQQGQDIFLKDNQTGTVTDLKQSAYSFTSNAGNFDGRFQLQFVDLPPQARITTALDVVAYVDPTHTLTLDAGAAMMHEVKIFDIRGRLVYTRPSLQTTVARLADLKAEHQVLLVQVRMEDGAVVTKKIAY